MSNHKINPFDPLDQFPKPRYHVFRDNEFLYEDPYAKTSYELDWKRLEPGDVIVPVERHTSNDTEFVKSFAQLNSSKNYKWYRAHELSDQIKAWLFMMGYEYESV